MRLHGLLTGGLHGQSEWQSLATRGLPPLADALGALVTHLHVSWLAGERRRSRQRGDRGLLADSAQRRQLRSGLVPASLFKMEVEFIPSAAVGSWLVRPNAVNSG